MSKKGSKSVLNQLLQKITPEKQRRTDNKMLLAVKIKEAMDTKGWKKVDLAKALNKEKSVITLWLSGTHNFKIDTLSDIEGVLDVKLLNVEKPEPKEENFFMHIEQSASRIYFDPYSMAMNQNVSGQIVSEPGIVYHSKEQEQILA